MGGAVEAVGVAPVLDRFVVVAAVVELGGELVGALGGVDVGGRGLRLGAGRVIGGLRAGDAAAEGEGEDGPEHRASSCKRSLVSASNHRRTYGRRA